MHPRWLCAKRKFTKNAPGGGFVVTFWEKQRRRMRNIICLSSMKLSSIQASRDCTWQWNMWCKLSFEIYANFGKRKRKSPWRQRERLLMFVNISFIVSMRLIKSAPWRVSNTPKGYRTGDSVVDKTKITTLWTATDIGKVDEQHSKKPTWSGYWRHSCSIKIICLGRARAPVALFCHLRAHLKQANFETSQLRQMTHRVMKHHKSRLLRKTLPCKLFEFPLLWG